MELWLDTYPSGLFIKGLSSRPAEGMGFGDFKLLAALGAWFGWMVLPGIVLISSAIGAIVGITLIVLGRPRDDAIAGLFGACRVCLPISG